MRWSEMRRTAWVVSISALALGSNGCLGEAPTAMHDAGPTCADDLELYADQDCQHLRTGIARFTPQYPLWSDGLAKDRYVYLPPGEAIDVSDPDAWVFPVGTRFWKHFDAPDGRHLETRVLEKVADLGGEKGWSFETYVWNEDGNDVTRVIDGRTNVLGTGHDIPAEEDCSECHSGGDNRHEPSVAESELLDLALGFGAIQLNHDASPVTLETLAADGSAERGHLPSGRRRAGRCDRKGRAGLPARQLRILPRRSGAGQGPHHARSRGHSART